MDPEWLKRMADAEDDAGSVSVGGLAVELGLYENQCARDATEVFSAGDVFQITPEHGRKGWIGAFVLATEIKKWGIQGFVVHVESHDEQRQAFIRLPWSEVNYVGHAPFTPSEG